MVLGVAPLLCPFIIVLGIFTLKKNIAKTHYKNVGLNIPNNAPMAVYQAAHLRIGKKKRKHSFKALIL
jgi:hypothetical protein